MYGAGIVAARLASLILLPVYTRYLTTADYGTLELLDTTLAVFSMFMGGRFADALFYHYANAGGATEQRRVLATSVFGAWIVGMVGGCVGLGLARPVSVLVFESANYFRYFQIVFAGFAVSLPVEVGLAWLRALDRPGVFVAVSVARLCLTLGLTIVLVVFLGMRVLGVLFSNLAVNVLLAVALSSVSLWKGGKYFNWALFIRILRFSLPMGIGGLGLFVMHFGDRFFLQRFASLSEVGLYALAYKLGMLVSQVAAAFGTYWTAQGYAILARPEGPSLFARVNTYMLAVVLWAGVIIVAFSPPVIGLIAAPAYFPALQYVPWIVLAYVLRSEADYFRFTFYLDGRTAADALLIWAAAGLCLAGYAILIPRYRLWGAVATTVAAFAFITVGARLATRRSRPYPLPWKRLLHLSLAAAAVATAVSLFQPHSRWGQFAAAAAASAAYPALLLLTGFFLPEERAAIAGAVRRAARFIRLEAAS